MSRLAAFLAKDWRIFASYRAGLAVRAGQILFTVAAFYFIGRLIDAGASPALAPYGGAYFPFVLLGLAFSRYLSASMTGLASALRQEQLQGTLEAVLATPTPLALIAIGNLLSELIWTTGEIAVYLGAGAVLFGLDLGSADLPASLVLLALTVASLSSLGVLSASGILLFREFDPVSWMLGGLMRLVGGVYFPVAILPGWLETMAGWVPLTYALEGMRQAVLMGRPLAELQPMCAALAAFALVLWPVALVVFAWTIRRLQRDGSLSFR
ncbi:MAG TPA: ABC transporter permease [bacterium]